MSTIEVLKVSADGRFRVRLEHDADCESPRRSDSLAHAVSIENSEYENVDSKPGPLSAAWDRLEDRYGSHRTRVFMRWARIFHGATVLRDIPMNGTVAVWYILPRDAKNVTDPTAYLECERAEYRRWAEGETFGYVIERKILWDRQDGNEVMTTWSEVTDADGWGLVGLEYATSAALEAFKAYDQEGSG